MESNWYIILWSIVIALGGLISGYFIYEVSLMWEHIPCVYGFDPKQRSNRNLLLLILGISVGWVSSLFTWYFAYFGKRRVILWLNLTIIIAWGIQMIPEYWALMIARLLKGFVFGVSTTVVPMFIYEISPVKYRGLLVGLTQSFLVSGLWVANLVGLIIIEFDSKNTIDGYWSQFQGRHIAWREFYATPGIIAVLQSILLFFFNKENPKYMMKKYNLSYDGDEQMFATSYEQYQEINKVRLEERKESSINKSEGSFHSIKPDEDTFKEMATVRGRRALIAGVIVHVFQQLSGINMVLYYTYFFRLSEAHPKHYNLRFVMIHVLTISAFASLYLMHKLRRKPLMLIGLMIGWAWNSLLFLFFNEIEARDAIFHSMVDIMVITVIAVYIITFSLSTGPLCWVYSAEVLTDKGMSIASSAHWIWFAFIAYLPTFIFKISKDSVSFSKQTATTFFFFAGITMLGFFVWTVFIKETFGLPNRQIREKFESGQYDVIVTNE